MTDPYMEKARETASKCVHTEHEQDICDGCFAQALREAVEEKLSELFNLEETEKPWQENFYESEWDVDTLKLTKTEKAIIEEMKSFLPRHMQVYDWNLPYAEFILLIFRKAIRSRSKPTDSKKG